MRQKPIQLHLQVAGGYALRDTALQYTALRARKTANEGEVNSTIYSPLDLGFSRGQGPMAGVRTEV